MKVDDVLLDVFIMGIGLLCTGYACQCLYVSCMHACHPYVNYAYKDMGVVVMHGVMVWLGIDNWIVVKLMLYVDVIIIIHVSC